VVVTVPTVPVVPVAIVTVVFLFGCPHSIAKAIEAARTIARAITKIFFIVSSF
jgi:hypothetical protein